MTSQTWTIKESLRHFTYQLVREMPKGKSSQDNSVNLSENIPTATETITQRSSIYLLGMSSNSSYCYSFLKLKWNSLSMKEYQGKLICHSSITRSLDLCILKLKKKTWFC